MPPQSVEQRVERLERQVSELEQIPVRMAGLRSQIAQLQGEMHAEFSATRQQLDERPRRAELHEELLAVRDGMRGELQAVREDLREELQAIRGNGARMSLATLHEEIRALRGQGGEGLTLAGLRQEIRDGDEETRRLMRVLHEDLVERIALLGKSPRFSGNAPRRRGKKKGSRRR